MPKETLPKLASGSIPLPDDGASAIHSAEFTFALPTPCEIEKVLCEVSSVIETVNHLPTTLTWAEIRSPGLTEVKA